MEDVTCCLVRALACLRQQWQMSMRNGALMTTGRKPKKRENKPVSVSLHLTRILHEVAWSLTRRSEVRVHCLTAWAKGTALRCTGFICFIRYRHVIVTRDEVLIANWICWTLTHVTANNYDSLTELHTQKVTVTTEHKKSSQYSLAVAWWRLPTVDIPLPLGSRTVPGLRFKFLASHNCNAQLTQHRLKVKVTLRLPHIRHPREKEVSSNYVICFGSDIALRYALGWSIHATNLPHNFY
jgi:hypothetical protein